GSRKRPDDPRLHGAWALRVAGILRPLSNPPGVALMNQHLPARRRPQALRHSLIAAALIAVAAGASAKTLVFCSEGSPENFYPGINTTGTSFDANSQIYGRIVDFERGTTKVVPGLAEKWDISEDGTVYTFHLRHNVKWHSNANFKPTRNFNADDVIFA